MLEMINVILIFPRNIIMIMVIIVKKKHCNRRIGTKLGKGYDNDIQCNGEILVIRNEISLQFQYHYLQWPIIAIMFTAV